MEWELILESLDGLDEKYHGLYTQSDDQKYHLDPNIGGMVTSITNLNATNRSVRQERDALKPWQKAIKDLGIEDVARLGTFVEELRTNADKAAGAEEHVARVRSDLEASHATALTEKDTRINKLEGALEGQIVQAASATAIAEADGKPKLLMPILSQRLKMVEDDNGFSVRVLGDDGEPMLDGTGGYLTIKGFLEKLKADSDYDDAFNPRGTKGPGTDPKGTGRPGTGNNPWAKDTWNMTEQGRIEGSNPELAKRLKSEAGHSTRTFAQR